MSWQVAPVSEYARYRDVWNRLNAASTDSALLHSDFIEPLVRQFGRGDECLAIYRDGGEPRIMGLLKARGLGVWETFQPSQMPIGPWINPTSVPLTAVLQALSRALPGPVLQVAITQQDPAFWPRPTGDDYLNTLDYIETARIKIDGPFEDYWSRRGKNLRQNLNRQRNRLQRDGIQTRLEVVTDPAAVPHAIQEYGELESAGWKAQEGTAVRADNRQGGFYTEIMQNFCRRGQGRIYRYLYQDRLVASDICIHHGEALVILKTTYDETITTSSPAMLMRRQYFEQIFDEGTIGSIEFYGRVMDWHTRMTDDVRTLYHVNFYRWPILQRCYRLVKNFEPAEKGVRDHVHQTRQS